MPKALPITQVCTESKRKSCMPLTTPLTKVSATKGYGADVVLHGANYDEACAEAIRRSQAEHLTFIHPFDDRAVIAGQGTLGLEMLQQCPDIEAIVVPDRRRRTDQRNRLRGQGNESKIQNLWRPAGASALHGSGAGGR